MRANQWTEALEHACAGEHDLARQRFGSLLSADKGHCAEFAMGALRNAWSQPVLQPAGEETT